VITCRPTDSLTGTLPVAVCCFEADISAGCRRRHSAVTQTTQTIQFQTHFDADRDDSVISLSLELFDETSSHVEKGGTAPHPTLACTHISSSVYDSNLHAGLFDQIRQANT